MTTLKLQAELAESQISKKLSETESNPYDQQNASAWIPSWIDGEFTKVMESGDVYQLLDSDDLTRLISRVKIVSISTCGWAAPISNEEDPESDGAPSEHPNRRRVRLIITATPEGVASSVRFQDTPEELITDEGSARGSLADAVKALMARASAEDN